MKSIKILLTVITVFALLFTVASAAGSPVKFADSVTYTEGENLVISIYGANGDIVTAGGYFGLEYDADVWEFVSWTRGTASSSDMNVNDYDGEVEICPTNGGDVTLTADDKICDIVFTYKAGEAVGSVFSFIDYSEFYNKEVALLEPAGSITVAAAGPVAVEDTKRFNATFDASDIEIDGVTYQNVAVINGSATAPVLEDGESITKVGIEYNDAEVRDLTLVSGGGNVTYKVLFYGITDAEAEALAAKVKTFYTGMFFPAN